MANLKLDSKGLEFMMFCKQQMLEAQLWEAQVSADPKSSPEEIKFVMINKNACAQALLSAIFLQAGLDEPMKLDIAGGDY